VILTAVVEIQTADEWDIAATYGMMVLKMHGAKQIGAPEMGEYKPRVYKFRPERKR
jgi:hypothetical protein